MKVCSVQNEVLAALNF